MALSMDKKTQLLINLFHQGRDKNKLKGGSFLLLRKRFWAVACATAMVASMTAGLSVNVFAADDTKDLQERN